MSSRAGSVPFDNSSGDGSRLDPSARRSFGSRQPGRRDVLTGLGGIVVAGMTIPWVAGCGAGSDTPPPAGSGAQPTSGSFPSADAATISAIGSAISKGEIPVGGAKFFKDAGIVVTQPTQGSYVALSTTCTHEGQTIDRVTNGQLVCPAHGSQFDPATGAATKGPAQAALPTKHVTVAGDTATLA
ncbi:MAG: Rieske (2Fe-2S) protein [Micrococcales bacterium]|nr:Rieske (2Fe-2S) protein [Micrococcales bacterium]